MRRLLASLAILFSLCGAAIAADGSVPSYTAATSVADGDIWYCAQSAGTLDRKCTSLQLASYIFGKVSGDLTCSGTGACTLKATGPGATGPLGSATVAPIITIDAQGRVTALSSATITQPGAANPTATAGPAANNGAASTFMRSDASPAVQKGSNAQFGIVEGDGSTITCVLGVCSSIGGGATGANPTATASDTANNGVATTFMRSDASPAVQKASSSLFGLAKVDNTTITASGGVISAVNNGTVTSVATGCGTTGGPITGSGTISAASTLRANTATTDTIVSTDCGNVVTESNAASIAVALPVASTSGFGAGTFFQVCNIGVGVATVTPTTSTIGGASSKAIQGGTAINPSCLSFQSDGTNYNIVALPVPAGLFTVTGALKGSGAGVVSQAACADLSNGGTACPAATGTSGHTLPFLDGNNTHSGTETFGSVFGAVSTQAGTTYTLAATDCGTEVVFTNAAAITVTIPAALTTGCNIAILQTTAAGQVTVTGTAVSAATLHSAHSYTKTFGQWAIIGINIETTGVAILTGDGA